MPAITLPFGSIFYREKGTGPALVMLMGTGADHTSWARQLPVVSKEFRVIAPDNRGSGRSTPPPPPDVTTDVLAGEVLAFLDALGVDRFHLAGFSFGAALAIEVALQASSRVISASFHAGWAGPNDVTTPHLERSRARIREGGVERFLESALRRNFSPAAQERDPAAFDAFVKTVVHSTTRPTAEGVLAQANAGLLFDARERLPALVMPVMVTAGEFDPVAPPAVAAELARGIPGARLHIFRGERAWHATPLEMPDEFNALLLEFHGSHR
jgi:3-oxoadipate enol-lactonase